MPTTDRNMLFSLRRWLGLVPARTSAVSAFARPDVQFEDSDISGLGVVLAGFGLLILIWIIVTLLYFVFTFFAHHRAAVSPPALPLATQLNSVPPAPRLQVSPRVDLKDLRAYEDSQLHKYAWVDHQKGIVSIPIERAMQLVATRGIPPQKAPASLKLSVPVAGTRMTGFEGKVEPEPR
ncbi:MAG TPA: hypothetical protein VKW78_05000 [Terriglobales bacterium]|nr:hypothetical protein [Terriglobales bacterium]